VLHAREFDHPGRRDERQSLYWRSRRNLPRDFRRGRPAEVQVRFRCSKHRIRGLLPVGRPGSASLQCRPANNRFEGYRDSNPWSPSATEELGASGDTPRPDRNLRRRLSRALCRRGKPAWHSAGLPARRFAAVLPIDCAESSFAEKDPMPRHGKLKMLSSFSRRRYAPAPVPKVGCRPVSLQRSDYLGQRQTSSSGHIGCPMLRQTRQFRGRSCRTTSRPERHPAAPIIRRVWGYSR
jgi:hypothetical protein